MYVVVQDDSGEEIEIDLVDGKLHVPTLAHHFKLDPSSVKLDNRVPILDGNGFTNRTFKEKQIVVVSGVAVQASDQSESAPHEGPFVDAMLGEPLPGPPPLHDLKDFMAEFPPGPVPTDVQAIRCLKAQAADLADHFVAASGRLANATGAAIWKPVEIGAPSEQDTAIAESRCVADVITSMDKARSGGGLGIIVERDRGDSSSMMTVQSPAGNTMRPDAVGRDGDGIRMLFKAEFKSAEHPLADARQDLEDKTAVWTNLYYGSISYLPCYAVAGSKLQFYAIPRGPMSAVPISRVFDLRDLGDRATLFQHIVQFYRLLVAQRELYPERVLQAGKELVAKHTEGWSRILFFRTDVLLLQKRIEPFSKYAAAAGVTGADLRAMYSATRASPGLVHADVVEVEEDDREGARAKRAKRDDCYTVQLYPVGIPEPTELLRTEDGVKCASHGLLHGLNSLHKAGFVHRDMRWPNTACSTDKRRWYLLDLEMCTLEGSGRPCGLRVQGWNASTLVGGRYTYASDLSCLGAMLSAHASVVQSEPGQAFLQDIVKPSVEIRLSAEQLLTKHSLWLGCAGATCWDAGAQAGEHW
eukprot:CAMPEP_0202893898 /NCGR_PEP_ID=MMETSP1392-20130828/3384_1 /ASSEMBLY_ACC=CAM_ASM_000868 /TAXON_ID=225041 /ORGANISM="Chlamydomonas chlamydogama, Strain SAG 11-48b" /LENGTH=583 /DNA_ID=CAMNT_0049578393 /DNA_START=120 /DNA_END=1871 /DNA_ORIENTATION=-